MRKSAGVEAGGTNVSRRPHGQPQSDVRDIQDNRIQVGGESNGVVRSCIADDPQRQTHVVEERCNERVPRHDEWIPGSRIAILSRPFNIPCLW